MKGATGKLERRFLHSGAILWLTGWASLILKSQTRFAFHFLARLGGRSFPAYFGKAQNTSFLESSTSTGPFALSPTSQRAILKPAQFTTVTPSRPWRKRSRTGGVGSESSVGVNYSKRQRTRGPLVLRGDEHRTEEVRVEPGAHV
jgi:hypothetical protein